MLFRSNSITSIGDLAFQTNRITRVTIGQSVTTIGASAFRNNRLTRVTFPNSVTNINGGAFSFNRLTRVNFMGDAPIAGGTTVFKGNRALKQVMVSASAVGWGSTWSGGRVVLAE